MKQEKETNWLYSKRFIPLFLTQFFAALNDNLLKMALVYLILSSPTLNHGLWIQLGFAIFMLPFFLFSALGGQLADKYDKASLARILKIAELAVAVLAIIALSVSSVVLLMVCLFLFGVGSALFGPIKYAVIPEQLSISLLPKANAWIETATFAAIILGALIAVLGINANYQINNNMIIILLVISLLCLISSYFMPKNNLADPQLAIDKNIFSSTIRLMKNISLSRRLFFVSLLISWFWLLAAVVISLLPILNERLGNYSYGIAYFQILVTIFIGVGSAIAAWLSAGRIVLLQSAAGAFIAAIFIFDLGLTILRFPADIIAISSFKAFINQPYLLHVSIDLALIAVSSAFLIIPGFAALQAWSKPRSRARNVAANNIYNALFISVGSLLMALSMALNVSLGAVLIIISAFSLIAAILIFKYMPTSAVQDFVSILFRAFFRLEVRGLENFKKAGRAPILALNHVSFLDGLLALAICETTDMKPPAFAMDYHLAKQWWIRPFKKVMNIHAIDPNHPLAIRKMIRLIEKGYPLVIFPEGRITVTGSLMKIYDGAAMIANETKSKIVPIRIEGLEKTLFSRLNEMQTKKRLFPKVIAIVTEPVALRLNPELSSKAQRREAANLLYEVMSLLIFKTEKKKHTLFIELKNAAKAYGLRRPAVEDPINGKLSYKGLLIGIRLIADCLKPKLSSQAHCAIMLANSNVTVITFFALQSLGKVPAMINFSAGAATINSATKTASIKEIITARSFIKKGKLENLVSTIEETGVRFIYLEDLKPEMSFMKKLKAYFKKMKPVVKQGNTEDSAAILFTSGSEGTPKGVVLSHENLLANCAQAAARIDFNVSDKLFNVLPMFHSFGLTAGTILPLIHGVPTYLYPSPLHYRIIPEVIYASNATIIFATDTFLNGYAKTAHPYDLRSIRYCFVGAEAVKDSTRQVMMNKFGIRVLEGYGVTEASPVIAINTPLYNKAGSVGRILPNIDVKLEKVGGIEKGGRLFIKGPNVMKGYLLAENPGQLIPSADGWHDTGDIVDIDENGFVSILGRAKRFAKIGGEMVSLSAIENLANRCWPEITTAVTAIYDERKGEKIILVSENEAVKRADLLAFARKEGVPELFVPSRVIYAEIPLLGTGKVDYPSLKELAEK